jgi:hypothetical protein
MVTKTMQNRADTGLLDRKMGMAKKKRFIWHELQKLRDNTSISDTGHYDTNFDVIRKHLRDARKQRRLTRANAEDLRKQFLQAQAKDYAKRTNTDQETALRAILWSEESKRNFHDIQEIIGGKTDRIPLTQIDINDSINPDIHTTITMKSELKPPL